MKTLSIRQPWAWAIIHTGKDVENRTWKTKLRGDFLVHASKKFDNEGYKWIKNNAKKLGLSNIPEKKQFELGGIIGKVKLVDCVENSNSHWFFGPIGFKLENPSPISFIPLKGKLSFFEVLFFENEDATSCHPLDHFISMVKSDGLKEISILEAIPDFRNEDHVWCGYVDAATERNECNKSSCDAWIKGKGNVCDNRGRLYSHGEKVTLKLD